MALHINMRGKNLLKKFISATGLPEEGLEQELSRLIARAELHTEELTLDELRILLAEYMQDILLAAKNEYSA